MMEKRGLVEKEQDAIIAYISDQESKVMDGTGLTKVGGADIEINVMDWSDTEVTFGSKIDGKLDKTYKVDRSEFNKWEHLCI